MFNKAYTLSWQDQNKNKNKNNQKAFILSS
jgi:hypothetical protein